MRIRKEHPGLRSANFYPNNWDGSKTQRDADGFGIDRGQNVVVYHRWGDDGAGRTERFYIVLNFSGFTRHVSFAVPAPGPWTDLISGTAQTASGGRLNVDIGSNWGSIWFRKD